MTAPLVPPPGSSVGVTRQMFQLIGDGCVCHLDEVVCIGSDESMRVPSEAYDTPGAVFL